MAQLGWPTILCHDLEVVDDRIVGYRLRMADQKRHAVLAFQSLGYRVVAGGDSYNDVSMLLAADVGFLFRAPDRVRAEFPGLPRVRHLRRAGRRHRNGLTARTRRAGANRRRCGGVSKPREHDDRRTRAGAADRREPRRSNHPLAARRRGLRRWSGRRRHAARTPIDRALLLVVVVACSVGRVRRGVLRRVGAGLRLGGLEGALGRPARAVHGRARSRRADARRHVPAP